MFDFNGHSIRVVDIDGEPWFPIKDVCAVLGIKNPSDMRSILENFEIRAQRVGSLTKGRPTKLTSESGVYKIAIRSNKPTAKTFQDWVAGTVLPAIRKDGAYVAGEERHAAGEMSDDELILKAHKAMQRKVARLQEENKADDWEGRRREPLSLLLRRPSR